MFIVEAVIHSDGRMGKKSSKVGQICRKDHTMPIHNTIGQSSLSRSCMHPVLYFKAISFINNLILNNLQILNFFDPLRPINDEAIIAEYPSFVHPNIW